MLFVKDIELIIQKELNIQPLIDCDLLAKVYINLIDQKEPTLNFQNQDHEIVEKSNSNITYYKKVIKPSSEESKKHKDYLKNSLKKNFY